MSIEMLTRKDTKNIKKRSSTAFLLIIGVISGILAGLYGIGALLVHILTGLLITEVNFVQIFAAFS
jgi:uncharacterized membrane protein YfcA